jgi:hypothetical protein
MTNEHESGQRQELEALKGSGRELDGFARVEAKVSKAPRAVFSLRLGAGEMVEIQNAAALLDETVGEFVRRAALLRSRAVHMNSDAFVDMKTAALGSALMKVGNMIMSSLEVPVAEKEHSATPGQRRPA